MYNNNRKGDQMKKSVGPLLAIIVFIFILIIGFFLGKKIAYDYNQKNNTNYNIFEILTIDNKEINYILSGNKKTVIDLCKQDIGLCNKNVGVLKLDNQNYDLFLYYNFDNLAEEISYFKIGNVKVENFANFGEFTTLNNKYLIVTENINNTSNYQINIYQADGKKVNAFEGTYNKEYLIIKDNKLYFYHCDHNDAFENKFAMKYYEIKVLDNDVQKELINKEYQNC